MSDKNTPFIRKYDIKAAENCEEALAHFLTSLGDDIRQAEGCIGYDLAKHQDGFRVTEEWLDESSYQASKAYFPKEKLKAAEKLFAAPPLKVES